MHGIYCAIEGIDGAGKTTVVHRVFDRLCMLRPELTIRITHHPGATPLGAHLRQLNLHPEQINPQIRIDPLSGQLLMMIDHLSFANQILMPSLAEGALVLADRCNFIGALAYGRAEGLSYETLDRMFRLVQPQRLDRLYVLQLPVALALQRLGGGNDRFERKGVEFANKLAQIYSGLTTSSNELAMVVNTVVALDNVLYLDATQPLENVVDLIVENLLIALSEAGL